MSQIDVEVAAPPAADLFDVLEVVVVARRARGGRRVRLAVRHRHGPHPAGGGPALVEHLLGRGPRGNVPGGPWKKREKKSEEKREEKREKKEGKRREETWNRAWRRVASTNQSACSRDVQCWYTAGPAHAPQNAEGWVMRRRPGIAGESMGGPGVPSPTPPDGRCFAGE